MTECAPISFGDQIMTVPKPGAVFKIMQGAKFWLLRAQELKEAAEIILVEQKGLAAKYERAVDEAGAKAEAQAEEASDGCAQVEIECREPNFRPAEMLLGFAVENALKGIIIVGDPTLTSEDKLARIIRSHNLCDLATDAKVILNVQEEAILHALTCLVVWAGRYPTPSRITWYEGKHDVHFGDEAAIAAANDHAALLALVTKLVTELERKVGPPKNRFGMVIFFKDRS